MTGRKNPFPGVNRIVDRHGKTRFRFRAKGGDAYLPGPYGSVAFRAAYDAAIDGAKAPNRSTAPNGTFAWLVEQYLDSPKYRNLSDSRKRSISRLLKNSNVTAAQRSELEKPSKIAPKLRFWGHSRPKYRILSLLRHPKNPFSAAC